MSRRRRNTTRRNACTMKRRLVRQELGEFMEKYDLDGVDYNWKYPGYRFGQGYLAESEVKADYEGLSKLVFETRQMYVDKGWANKAITMAYYPDSRQEQLLRDHGIAEPGAWQMYLME
ncbi:unnamed protein product [Durusdinium trenchii]|uniref:Uncharacterized protein n=1 Tax=Durusdinium trenchii TaxID=1381693 RepID=A0ABP0S7Z0_9DINO